MGPPPAPDSDLDSLVETASVTGSATDYTPSCSRSRSRSRQPRQSLAAKRIQQLEQEVKDLEEQARIQELMEKRTTLMAKLANKQI
jgi:hypothetical protein